MKEFKFSLPNGEKHTFKYDDDSDRVEIVNEFLQADCFESLPVDDIEYCKNNGLPLPATWQDYMEQCWIYFGKVDKHKLNHEDKVKLMLNALAAFLDNSSMLESKSKDISLDYIKDGHNQKKQSYDTNNILLGLQNDRESHDNKSKRIIKKYKKSRTYKITRIFSQDDYIVNEIYKLKNKDVYHGQYGYFMKKYNLNGKNFEKWLNKSARDIKNQSVFDIKTKKYKGWEGIINKNKPYSCEWCYVWSDGTFVFNNNKFKIDIDKVPQYKDIRKDKYYKDESGWSMDSVFCIEQDGIIHFWDMNIDKIDKEYILHN